MFTSRLSKMDGIIYPPSEEGKKSKYGHKTKLITKPTRHQTNYYTKPPKTKLGETTSGPDCL